MKYVSVFVVTALIVSLVTNFYLLSKMKDIENSVYNISNLQMDLTNNMSHQTANINNILDEYKREQSWISTVQMNVEKQDIEKGTANLRFEWQVKELQKGSEVIFHYKMEESQKYTSIPAEEKGNGLFEVHVPVKVQLEPEWFVHTTIVSSRNSEPVMEEHGEEKMADDLVWYYVTVSHDELVKSSEATTAHLENMGTMYYGILETNIHLNNEEFTISIMEHGNVSDVFIKEAYLLKYKNEKVVAEEKLRSGNLHGDPEGQVRDHFISFIKSSKEDFSMLELKVTYSNGTSFEKEIYTQQ
ncbi:hypothetical protein ACLM5H_08695 [Fredinandcohnia humi]